MRKFATAVLFLFAVSLIGSAFADSCIAMSRGNAGVEAPTPPCCAMKSACFGGGCSSSIQQTGCLSQATWSAVVQKHEIGGLPKFVPVLVAIEPASTTAKKAASPPPLLPPCRHAEIVDYSDIFARTGRLLI